jgi:predicted nucleic acid-binding protein
MNDRPFFDTNIVLYAFRRDDARTQVAETLLAAGGAISVQVLNEFVAVARRKLQKSWEDVDRALDILRVFCPEPVPLTIETHQRALHIAKRYGYSIFDSLVIAAAIQSGANTLYSEDMRNGQVIDSVTIRNPFSALAGGLPA